MKCSGVVTELEIEMDEADFAVTEAVVTKNRISIDWDEYGKVFNVVMNSTDGGATYEGIYGDPRPNANWSMTATRYDSANGSILLLAEWVQEDGGKSGVCMFELDPVV